MMKRLASNLYATHSPGRVMDGLSDRLGQLVGDALSRSSDTFYLVIHKTLLLPPSTPGSTPVTPTSCSWPLIIALPLLAMCWESKGSHLSLIKMEPHHLLPRALNHNQSLGRQRWIGTSATPYLPGVGGGANAPKSCCQWQIIAVILGGLSRSSLPPLEGSCHKALEGNSFLLRNNSHNV